MLFKPSTLEAIAAGRVSLAFRRWKRPRVKPGSTIRTPAGVIEIVSVETILQDTVTEQDAVQAGCETRGMLFEELARYPDGDLYRIELRSAGADPRIALRAREGFSAEERRDLELMLSRMGAKTSEGPWALPVLRLIAARPGVRAAMLAKEMGMDTLPFKARVRHLNNLGLTESLEIGYRLSPRGAAFLRLEK